MKQEKIDKIRSFNRFYTMILGVLNRRYMGSNFGLPEIRVIQDIYLHPGRGAKEISKELNIDKGYMSRLIKKLEKEGHVSRTKSKVDGRREIISLTEVGTVTYHTLNNMADDSVRQIYAGIDDENMERLTYHMQSIEDIINSKTITRP